MKQGIFKGYISFLKKPDFTKKVELSVIVKLIELFKIYLITILFLVLANLINKILIKLGAYEDFTQYINKITQLPNKTFSITYLSFALCCAPILEEFTFRLLLTKYKKTYIIISISLIFGFLINRFFYAQLWHFKSVILFNIAPYLYPVLFALPIFTLLFLIKFDFEYIWNRYYSRFFYLIAILFAILHIPALDLNIGHLVFIPIIALPYFISALSLGYARNRYGILFSIILHFVLNAPLIVKTILEIKYR